MTITKIAVKIPINDMVKKKKMWWTDWRTGTEIIHHRTRNNVSIGHKRKTIKTKNFGNKANDTAGEKKKSHPTW